ncbi:MAG TPA: hypothetical protein VNB90_10560 [Cytophagaceae bacterium]|nr:hypothetical protein [Cytophagaceae bacterium]
MTRKDFLPLLLALFFYLLSFPEISPVYGTGLDPSYTWALNWLFVHDRQVLTDLFYSIGPLGFLKFPTTEGNNLLYFYLFFSFLKILFLFLLLRISFRSAGEARYTGMLMLPAISFYFDLDILLIGNCFLLLYLYLKNKNIIAFLLASLLCSMAILIKSSIGISCISLLTSSLILHLFLIRSVKQTSFYFTAFLCLYSIPLLLVFGNFEKIVTYHIHIKLLSDGYSTALALQTHNNWWLLTSFLLCFGVAPFIFKSKDTKLIFPLLLFPLFALWKHSMGREDISHNAILLYALFMLWTSILILTAEFNFKTIGLAMLSIGLYLSNMLQIPGAQSYELASGGPSYFYNSIIEFSKTKKTSEAISLKNIAPQILSPSTRALIGDSSIDIYPWELSYLPANHLHWKPRHTIELSASSTKYISEETSKSYLPPHAPEFILFHLQNDQWGGRFGSLDGRYILNDEPRVIYAILNHYTLAEKNPQYLLFRKNNKEKLTPPTASHQQYSIWNEWIPLPPISDTSLLRMRFYHQKTFLGKLKNFLYKDEEYYIDYLFSQDSILTYRFIPSNAADGLWLHPFILNPYSKAPEAPVQKIRFRHSASSILVEDAIGVQWESIDLVSSEGLRSKTLDLFHKTDLVAEKIIWYLKNDFEQSRNTKSIDSTYHSSGNYSMKILPEEYSYAYKLSLDSLWKKCDCDRLNLSARIQYLANSSAQALLVMNVDSTDKRSWKATNLTTTTREQWLPSYIEQTIHRAETSEGKLYVYIWNNGTKPVYLDDFILTVKY